MECTHRIGNVKRAFLALLSAISAAVFLGGQSQAHGFWEKTFLLDVSVGSSRSDIARGLRRGGFELADGTPIYFTDWYTPAIPDFNLKYLTTVTPDFGLIWGVSTGEKAEKYQINPGLWLGFLYREQISRNSNLSLSAVTLIGGNFRERMCVGDWPEFGGRQQVNCRLAATPLPPQDTLKFLVRERGIRETRATLRYQILLR